MGLRSLHINLQAQVKVVAIYCDENKVRHAGPGENVRVRISGIEEEDIISGFVLSSIGRFYLIYITLFSSLLFNDFYNIFSSL